MISEKEPLINAPDTPSSKGSTVLAALYRYSVLFLICLMTFGSYYVYDLPGALQNNLEAWYGIDTTKYELFYSVYSWPNTVIAFCGGYLVDRVFGIRIGSILFATLVTIGQIVFAIGVTTHNYWLAIVGRFIFGLGGESLAVSQSAYTAKWFTGKELAMSFAITISFSRVGSAVNFNLSPRVAQWLNLPSAFWLGAIFCGVSLLNCLVLALVDKRNDTRKALEATGPEKEVEKISLFDVLQFPFSIWAIYAIVVSFYVAVFIYITVGKSVIISGWPGISSTTAGTILGLPYTVSSGASPIFGILVDLTGRNLMWMISAAGALAAVHASLAFLHFSTVIPWVSHIVMGVAYSALAASLWPSIAVILPARFLGSAYGLAFALQNLGLAVFPLIIGQLLVWTNNNYSFAEYVFLGCASTACLLSVLLLLWDLKDPKLNLSGSELRRRAKAAKEAEENP